MDIKKTVSSKNESDQILKKLQVYLEKHRLKEIEELIDENVWKEIDNDAGLKWDMIMIISSRLKTLNKYRFKTFEMCQSLLIDMVNNCNPKETLIVLLAELENSVYENDSNVSSEDDDKSPSPKKFSESSFDNCMKSLFIPLKIVINKIPNQKESNLAWVLGLLNCYFLKISVPDQNKTLMDQKTSDLDLNSTKKHEFEELHYATNLLQRFDFLLPDYLNFLSEFVDQYASDNYKFISAKYFSVKITLIKALLSILHHPLMYLDLSEPLTNMTMLNKSSKINFDKDIIGLANTKDNLISELKGVKCFKQNSQLYAFQIVNLISRLEPNIFELYELESLIFKFEENANLKFSEDLVKYSFGVQAYIVYVLLDENFNFVPSIYSPIYAFQKHIPYVISLLERSESFICEKGIRLIEKLIFKVPDLSLKSNFLDFLREYPLDKMMIKIMRFSSKEQHRRIAFNVYKKLIIIFENKGRYNFIYKTSAEPNQFSGVRGLMITIYKDLIFQKQQNQEFVGNKLQNFMRMIMSQVNLAQEEFDLIENMDWLMSLLNFMRFLFIWDKKSNNETGVFNELNLINDFLARLKKKIEFSRNFLNVKINSTRNCETRKKKKIVFDINCVNGDDNLTDLYRNMTTKDEINMYKQSLANVDMMDSVLARVNELISINSK